MSGLTITEKEHWKERIAKRIDKRIDALAAAEPNFFDRMQRESHQRALQSLGLAEHQAEIDRIEHETEAQRDREQLLNRTMLALVRGVSVNQIDEYHAYRCSDEVARAVARRQTAYEDELLVQTELGRQIVQLRQEKDNLLDTVWLATSPANIKTLWEKVGSLLGDELSPLQREALAIPAMGDE